MLPNAFKLKGPTVTLRLAILLMIVSEVRSKERKGLSELALDFISTLKLTHWGDWDSSVTCPGKTFIVGVRVRYKHENIINDTQTNNSITISYATGLEISCTDRISLEQDSARSARFGKGGKWSEKTVCSGGFATGISSQMALPWEDGILATSSILNFTLRCSDGRAGAVLTEHEDDEGYSGEYLDHGEEYFPFVHHRGNQNSYTQNCEEGEALWGLQISADSVITFLKGDRSAVRGVNLECRKVVNPSINCNIEFSWEKVKKIQCDEKNLTITSKRNSDPKNSSLPSINCTFEIQIGVEPNKDIAQVEKSFRFYHTMGRYNSREFVRWNLLKKLSDISLKSWFQDNFTPDQGEILLHTLANTFVWKDTINITREVEIPPQYPLIPENIFSKNRNDLELKFDPVMEQLVGRCSIYKLNLNLLKASSRLRFETKIKRRLTRIVFGSSR